MGGRISRLQLWSAVRPPAFPAFRQRSEQWVTFSQSRSHFLRQVKGSLQTTQVLVGRSDFLRIFGMVHPAVATGLSPDRALPRTACGAGPGRSRPCQSGRAGASPGEQTCAGVRHGRGARQTPARQGALVLAPLRPAVRPGRCLDRSHSGRHSRLRSDGTGKTGDRPVSAARLCDQPALPAFTEAIRRAGFVIRISRYPVSIIPRAAKRCRIFPAEFLDRFAAAASSACVTGT